MVETCYEECLRESYPRTRDNIKGQFDYLSETNQLREEEFDTTDAWNQLFNFYSHRNNKERKTQKNPVTENLKDRQSNKKELDLVETFLEKKAKPTGETIFENDATKTAPKAESETYKLPPTFTRNLDEALQTMKTKSDKIGKEGPVPKPIFLPARHVANPKQLRIIQDDLDETNNRVF